MKKEKSCGSIVIDNDKVLIVKHNAGHWDFPKGHVENKETEEETAIREVKEETNIDVEIDSNYRYITTYSPKEGVIKDVIFFLGRPLSYDVNAQEEEVNIVKFVTFDEAFNLLTYDSAKDLLTKAINDKKKLALTLDKCQK